MSKRSIPFFILFSFLFCSTVLWFSESLQTSIRTHAQRIIAQKYLEKVEPRLPFKIENFQIKASWKDFRAGRIPMLSIVLRWNDTRVKLSGSLEVHLINRNKTWRADYHAQLEITPFEKVIDVHFWVEAPRLLESVDLLGANITLPDIGPDPWRDLKWKRARLYLNWKTGVLESSFAVDQLEWSDSPDHVAVLNFLQLQLSEPLALNSFTWPDRSNLLVKLKSSEVLWNAHYLTSDSSRTQMTVQLNLNSPLRSPIAGLIKNQKGRLDFSVNPTAGEFGWKTSDLPLSELKKWLNQPAWAEISRGTLKSHGSWSWHDGSLSGTLQVQNADAQLSDGSRLSGGKLLWRAQNNDRHSVTIEIPDLRYKKFKASLPSTLIQIHRSTQSAPYQLDIDQPFGLVIKDIPLQIAPVHATLNADGTGLKIETALSSGALSLSGILQKFCIPTRQAPPASITLQFPKFEITSQSIRPSGQVFASLLNGEFKLTNTAIYGYTSAAPEFQFDAEWKNLQLARLGDWLGFGEMDGAIQGYAKNVTTQAWLPTQFDFKFELKPNLQSDIVFSPDAMKNVVNVFAGNDINSVLPGSARWIAFGWPSRFFGGYDMLYGGIEVQSSGGEITVRTLDPESIVTKERKHFILYGPRFRMPLNSTAYPLQLDGPAMGRFVRQMLSQLEKISQAKNPEEKNKNENTDSIDTPCRPDPQ